MKIYCSCCDKVQPVRIDNCRDAKTNEPFQDIVCAECDLVIAAGTDIVPPAQQQEPVAWTDLLKKADEIVRGKIVWKRFIDGTPLANDIAVWMADFAQQHTSPQPPQRKPLTDEEIAKIAEKYTEPLLFRVKDFARAIEAAHGIKE